nr:folate family ECF transporter S component [Mycoplasmopsis mustelae]
MIDKVKSKNWKEISLFPKWTIKNMVMVSILIAISVSFTIVVAQIIPIVSLPTYKFSFIGLPVKIAGFIFGPVVGVFVGIVSDLLSLLFIPPAGYNPVYTVATAINGLVSGLFGIYFNQILKTAFSREFRLQRISQKLTIYAYKYKFLKDQNEFKKADVVADKLIKLNNKKKYINQNDADNLLKNIYLFASIILLTLVIASFAWFVLNSPDEIIQKGIIKNKYILLGLMSGGTSMMLFFVFLGRFFFKTKTYLTLVPIVVFSAFLELVNIPVLAYADLLSLGNKDGKDIFFWISQHILSGPVKIWFNTFVIYYTYEIISKLIYKNSNLSYK